jgi:1,4-alpha-glucan branching enzyme
MNHESKVTRDYSKRVLQYWVREFKIDGYRFDLSKGLTQTNSGQDAGLMSRYDASRIAILKDYASAVRAVDPTSIVIYEHFADNDEEKELSRDGSLLWANGTWSGAQAILGFDNQDVAGAVSAQRRGFQRHGLIGYVESHDEERMLVRGVEARDTTTVINRLEALMVTLLCIPGPKMLWQFNEVAYPHSINLNGRLGRKPLAWPLLSDGRRERLRRAVAELSTARQLYASFASMSATLQTYDKLKTIVLKDPSCDVVLIANLDVTTRTSTIPFTRKGVWYEFFRDTTDAYYIDNATVTLRPGEYRLWSTQPLRGSATTGAIDEGHVSVANNADVYPNPASEAIHVRIPEAATSVAVVDVLGRVRWSTSDTSVSAWSIDCSTWPTGTYSLRIASLHGQQVSTFVVQR